MKQNWRNNREDIEEIRKALVEKLITQMEKGEAFWQKEWQCSLPRNMKSDKAYEGINFLTLHMEAAEKGYTDDRWLTYKQAKELDGQVRKGEHGTKIFYFGMKEIPEKDADGKEVINPETGKPKMREYPVIKHYTVFNVDQIDGLTLPPKEPGLTDDQRIEKAERILKESGAAIEHGGDRAYYNPKEDRIQLPERQKFKDLDGYYATALHELSHWTGHESRLNRPQGSKAEKEKYAREELVAELSSFFTAKEADIPITEKREQQTAGYLKSWIDAIREDPKVLFTAMTDAHKSAEYVLKHERKRELEKKEQFERLVKKAEKLGIDKKEIEKAKLAGLYPEQKKALKVLINAKGKEVQR